MRNTAIFVCVCLLVAGSSCLFSQVSAANDPGFDKIPPVIFDGLHQLANQNPAETEKTWFHWAVEAGGTAPSDLPDYLASHNVGAYQNFDVVSVQDITPRMRTLYLALNFERDPVIIKFVFYRTTEGWILRYHKVGIDQELFESIAQVRQ